MHFGMVSWMMIVIILIMITCEEENQDGAADGDEVDTCA